AGDRRDRPRSRTILDALQHADGKWAEDEQITRQLLPAARIVYGCAPPASKRIFSHDGAVLYAAVALLQHAGLFQRSAQCRRERIQTARPHAFSCKGPSRELYEQ